MSTFLAYLFDSTPPVLPYESARMLPLLVVCLALILGSYLLSRWRRGLANPVTSKLSRTWPAASFVFGFVGFVFLLSRAEGIQFISMRFWWVIWFVLGFLFVFLQYRVFKARHYQVMPSEHVHDPREKYLPKKKK